MCLPSQAPRAPFILMARGSKYRLKVLQSREGQVHRLSASSAPGCVKVLGPSSSPFPFALQVCTCVCLHRWNRHCFACRGSKRGYWGPPSPSTKFLHGFSMQRGLGEIKAPHSPVLSALEKLSVALQTWVSSRVKSKVFLEFPGNSRVKWKKSWVFQKSCLDTCTSVQLIRIGFDPTYSRGGFFLSKWACWVAGGELMSPPWCWTINQLLSKIQD